MVEEWFTQGDNILITMLDRYHLPEFLCCTMSLVTRSCRCEAPFVVSFGRKNRLNLARNCRKAPSSCSFGVCV